jgi:hypothetical protein
MVRDDISVIDGASAVLSVGGGKSFSVRSSKLSKFSILTPRTQVSCRQSVQSVTSSSHKPQSQESESKPTLPFPYLQAFIEDAKSGSKRVVFDHSTFNSLQADLKAQMVEKMERQKQERLAEFATNVQQKQQWRQQMVQEQ